jgi:Leucine-rich repeat (LRR) protein
VPVIISPLILQVEDDAFQGLSSLEKLSLKDNNILLIPASTLSHLPSLTALQLDYNRVAALSGEILRAVASRVTVLSLARNVVRELPSASFKEFTHLQTLDLSGNLLANVAAITFIGLEGSLVKLHLSGNRLTSLPSSPIALPQLELLDMSRNQLAEVPRIAFTQLPSLVHLNLSHNTALGSISPTLLHSLPQLTELDLSQTGLNMLSPELLLRSQNLEKVFLCNNLIQELPEGSFRNLRNLTTIDLSYNQILNIRTGAFMGLKSIKELYLNNNRLTAFKGEFFQNFGSDGSLGTTLEVLNLANNELSYLFPSSFRVHPRLHQLIASGNMFSFFPAELIASLQYLEYIDLGYNSLRSVEDLDFASLPRLRTLILSHNELETISELAFQNSTQLQILDVSGNKIERLGERTFEGLVRLEMLNLENNLLSELPDAIFERSRLQMLESINLAGNLFEAPPLQPLQRQYFFLSAVDLSRNQIHEIPPEDSIMVNIKKLDLSYNPLSQEAVENVLGEPKTVRDLNLAGTGITSVTQMETPFLRRLNLSHNSINSLPDTVFERPTLLEDLDISHNSLSELPHVWQRLKNLQVLDVSENPVISILQGDFDGLEGLRYLRIHDLTMCTRLEKNAFTPLGNLAELEAYGYPRLGYLDVPGILQSLPALVRLDIELKDAAVSGDQLKHALQPRLQELGLRGLRVRSLSSGVLAGLRGPAVRVGLHNTSVSALPPALFFTLPRSTRLELDVSGSQLTTLGPPLLAALDERKGDVTLTGLSDNPINCDCGTRALRRWLPGAGMSEIRCFSPENLKGQLLVEVADDDLICDPNRPSTTTPSTLAPSPSATATTEPDIIWSVPPNKAKTSSSNKPGTGTANKATPVGGSSSLNNDDTLIIGIVGGVVAFIAILIIVICIIRIRITNSQYRGGPLATPGALATGGHAPSMITAGSGCTCVKPPMGLPMYMAPYGPGYAATLPSKLMPPTSVSPRPPCSTMGRQPYYHSPPYYITYPADEKEHR